MDELIKSALFPVEELSPDTVIKLPDRPNAESDSIKLYIIQAEPNLFLEGFTPMETKSRPPTLLRGCLFIKILKPVRIKSISLKLSGTSRTEWPEGIPPKKTDHTEINNFMQHTWPFFNWLNYYPSTPASRNNADLYIPRSEADPDLQNFSLDSNLTPVTSPTDNPNELISIKSPSSLVNVLKGSKRKAVAAAVGTRPSLISHSSDLEITSTRSNSGPDDNKLFPPGDYIYSFEQPIQASLPESTKVTFGSVSYFLEANLERSGAFKTSLYAKKRLNIVRAASQDSSEENEPIVISRDWEDQLKYEIFISTKQILLNSYVPVAFRLTPLEKIKIQRLRVYLTEHLEYFCRNKTVHRTEPPKKYLLMEHKSSDEKEDNLLAIEGGDAISAKEFEFQVYVPEKINEKHTLHPDTSFDDIQSHHWIKLCIRISKLAPTPEDPHKRKHFELSIDSPVHVLSSHCAHANTLLPAYVQSSAPPSATDKDPHLDILMSPTLGPNTKSNLFKPQNTIPIEMMSSQATPFSPVVSPELHSMSPELRPTPMSIRPGLFSRTSFNQHQQQQQQLVSPPPQYDIPPPNFDETAKDVPPPYEQLKKEDTDSASDASSFIKNGSTTSSLRMTTASTSSSKLADNDSVDERQTRRDRYQTSSLVSASASAVTATNTPQLTRDNTTDSQDDSGDLGGHFKLRVIPISSRSNSHSRSREHSPSGTPVRSTSPAFISKYKSKSRLINSSVLPGYSNLDSTNALDFTIAQAIERENLERQRSSGEEDGDEDECSATGPPNLIPPDNRSRRSSFSSMDSTVAISLASEDPLAQRPLLHRDSFTISRNSSAIDHGLLYPSAATSSYNNYNYNNNNNNTRNNLVYSNNFSSEISIPMNLGDRQESVDITSLITGDSTNSRSDDIWHPFNLNTAAHTRIVSSNNLKREPPPPPQQQESSRETGLLSISPSPEPSSSLTAKSPANTSLPSSSAIRTVTDKSPGFNLNFSMSPNGSRINPQMQQQIPAFNENGVSGAERNLSFGIGPVLAALNSPDIPQEEGEQQEDDTGVTTPEVVDDGGPVVKDYFDSEHHHISHGTAQGK